ncbi:MAG: endonuclease/exonuclease/phosphatase family protein [Nannocystaceae bacterium]|nr:endonuclease/exonuclease/phosphatase family protein [Nannocystaceae bacterium]
MAAGARSRMRTLSRAAIDTVARRTPRVPARPRVVECPLDVPAQRLEHALQPHFAHLARVPHRRALQRDPVYRRLAPEIDRVLEGFAWDLDIARPRADATRLRAVAWNVERGKRFAPLMAAVHEQPELRDADLLLLTELDVGMGRSCNRDVPREIARATGMAYVYANFHLVLAPGDSAEQEPGFENTLGLHGAALFSRWPVRRAWAVELPEFTDKFHAIEKRLGSKRALVCELMLPAGPLAVVVVHLDPFAPPAHRAAQLRGVLDAVAAAGVARVLVGGDFNTNTYHLGSSLGLGVDVLNKLWRFGFEGTVRQYMTPEHYFERDVFAALTAAGLRHDGFTDPGAGTIHYDLNDPEVRDKSLQYLPRPVFRWLERRLSPWNGCVPMRVDHFAGRGVRPLAARTLPRDLPTGRVSDHAPLVLDFELEPLGRD